MSTISGAWSEGCQNSGRIVRLSNSKELGLRNIRLMTEFEPLLLFKYLIETKLVECKKYRSKASAISISKSLWTEWKRYKGSQLLLWQPLDTKSNDHTTSKSLKADI